jgi:hypothetical protein
MSRLCPDRLKPEVRHAHWLAKQVANRIHRRQQYRQVPSARDLDAVAEEEKAREATRGLDPAKSNSADLPVERSGAVR